MSPFGLENLPSEVVNALRTLPVIAERLEEVASHTQVLATIRDDVADISQTRMAGIDERLETIEKAMPVLVEVQQHLARLPETMQRLDDGITGLTELLGHLVKSIETLDTKMGTLQESVEPVGRLADKLPGSSRRR